MLRRSASALASALVALLTATSPVAAHVELVGSGPAGRPVGAVEAGGSPTTSPPGPVVPRTTLEAQERDDGTTSAAPWIVGSGVAALAAIGIGGTLLKRRTG